MRSDEKKCPQCAETIKRDAKVCRYCGYTFSDEELAEAKKRSNGPAIAAVIAVLVVLGLISIVGHEGPRSSDAASIEHNADMLADNMEMQADNMDAMANATLAAATGGDAGSKSTSGHWEYADRPDKMRGGTMHTASVTSTDTVHLAAPYSDDQPVLHIRRDPKFGFDIYFTSEGQPLCRPFMSGHVSIKFDNGAVQRWGCNEAADGSSGVVFLESAHKLLGRIKGAKTMTIEDDYYDAGRQVFSFPVEGLKW